MLISIGIMFYSCNGNVDKTNPNTTTKNTTPKNNGLATGTYNASGTITFTAGGENYSCSISKVIAAPTVLTIQTSSTAIQKTGSITISCYTASNAVTSGTYSAATPAALSTVTLINKKIAPYNATSATSGSSCTVNITTLTSSSIKGTFTATAMAAIGKTSISITNGIIDCAITSK